MPVLPDNGTCYVQMNDTGTAPFAMLYNTFNIGAWRPE